MNKSTMSTHQKNEQRLSTVSMIVKLLLVMILGLLFLNVEAHSGKTCYAHFAQSPISIDRNLTDWPQAGQYNIQRAGGTDFQAYFMVNYNEQTLYVAMAVTDDIHLKAQNSVRNWDRKEDRHILFLDFDHSLHRGSGVITLFGDQNGGTLEYAPNNWDPFHHAVTEDDVNVVIKRVGKVTTYEWSIDAPIALRPFLSLGIDHYVHDLDNRSDEPDYYEWGTGGFKDRLPFRLGDVMLLPADHDFGKVSGQMGWEDQKKDRVLPTKVVIQSDDYELMWTTVELDSAGRFTKKLPSGFYRIFPLVKTATTANQWDIERINKAKGIFFAVKSGVENELPAYTMALSKKPDYLIPVKGMLNSDHPFDKEAVDVVVQAFKDYCQIPGVSLAVIQNGKLVYEKQYGTSNTTTNQPLSASTRFEIASVSKPIFAYAVHRLADRGVIDLEKPLHEYKEFKSISHDPRHKLLTAGLVLSHQTGMPNWLWNRPRDWENGEKGEFIGDPESGFFYSGEMYEYLMRVVEEITGKTIEKVIEEEVYAVFGMNESGYTAKASFRHHIAVGHLHNLPMYWNVHEDPWVAGSMYATALDLSRFALGLLRRKGLSQNQFNQMLTPQVEIDHWVFNYGGDKQYWSLGFEVEDSPYGRFHHHDGSNGDFESRLAINLEKNYGYVLLTNNGNGEYLDRIIQRLLFTGRSDNATPVFD